MVSPVVITGFEHGITPATAGGGLANDLWGTAGTEYAVQGTIKRTGDYALKLAPTATTRAGIGWSTSGAITGVVGRVYVYISANPSSAAALLHVADASGAYVAFGVDGSGNFALGTTSSSLFTVRTTCSAYNLNTWYCIDLYFDVSANPQVLKCKVGGTEYTYDYADPASTFSSMRLGCAGAVGPAWTAYFDDLIWSETLGDYPIGAGEVHRIKPGSDGTHNNAANILEDILGNDIDGSTYYAYDKLDEIPLTTSANTDLVRQAAVGATNYCEVQFEDTTLATIHGAQALLQYASETTSANNGACIIRDSNGQETTVWGNPSTQADYSETSVNYKRAIVAVPSGGWSSTHVNALRSRFGYSGDATPDPYWLALLIEVAGIPGGTTFYSTPSGALSSVTGGLVKQGRTAPAGTLTTAGTLAKAITRAALTAALTTVGSLVARTGHGLTGTLASAGALVGRANKALAGTVSTAGTLAKAITRAALLGTLGSAGTLTRWTGHGLTGTLSSAGTLATAKLALAALAGTLTSTGALTVQTARTVAGTLSGAGTLVRQTAHGLARTLATAGTLAAQKTTQTFYQAVDAVLSTAGAISRRIDRALSGRLW